MLFLVPLFYVLALFALSRVPSVRRAVSMEMVDVNVRGPSRASPSNTRSKEGITSPRRGIVALGFAVLAFALAVISGVANITATFLAAFGAASVYLILSSQLSLRRDLGIRFGFAVATLVLASTLGYVTIIDDDVALDRGGTAAAVVSFGLAAGFIAFQNVESRRRTARAAPFDNGAEAVHTSSLTSVYQSLFGAARNPVVLGN